jgi:hypothetical protein
MILFFSLIIVLIIVLIIILVFTNDFKLGGKKKKKKRRKKRKKKRGKHSVGSSVGSSVNLTKPTTNLAKPTTNLAKPTTALAKPTTALVESTALTLFNIVKEYQAIMDKYFLIFLCILYIKDIRFSIKFDGANISPEDEKNEQKQWLNDFIIPLFFINDYRIFEVDDYNYLVKLANTVQLKTENLEEILKNLKMYMILL